MDTSIYTNLTWLESTGDDHTKRCRALASATGNVGAEIRALSNCRLDSNQLIRLARGITATQANGCQFDPLQEVRLGILTNSTADFLEPAVLASAPRHGLMFRISRGSYGQVMQDALAADSALNIFKPAIVLCALDYRWFALQVCPGDEVQARAVLDDCMAQIRTLVQGVKANCGAVCVLQTLVAPVETLFGSLDSGIPGTMPSLIAELNRSIIAYAKESESILFDVANLASLVGTANWHDPVTWNLAKLPFDQSVLPLYAEHVARLVAAQRGKARRCLILDLDNTVWGGVIGDDGLEGIQIAQGDATGEAHLDVQRFALSLRSRGVVLAVCSKNTDEVARKPFQEHPEMLLKLDHIAVFQANWNDKASNIKAIAEELSLGLESMVFMDDNPMERDIVRQMLPQVAVPELPPDPANYVRTVSAGGYFESTRFSAEDLRRADFYQDNSRRAALKQQAGDLDSYLASLEMKITFQPFDEMGRTRIAQLISKSNQFNLTSRRYSEADVAQIQTDPDCFSLQVRLADVFADNGMISVVIVRRLGEAELDIDTWLMSCRVLGRRVENMVLQELINHARSLNLTTLVGRYRPTDRNALVKDHYLKLGFDLVQTLPDGETIWHLDVAGAPEQFAPMQVVRAGYSSSEAVPLSVSSHPA